MKRIENHIFGVITLCTCMLAGIAGAASVEERLGLERPVVIKSNRQAGLLRAGDMNGDGKVDFLTVLNSRGLMQIYLQQEEAGLHTFEKREEVMEDNLSDMLLMDWNGNGRLDVLMTTSDQTLGVRFQQADGSLAPMEKIQDNARYLITDDMDADGKMDLLAGDGGKMAIYYGPAKGQNRADPSLLYISSSPLGRPGLADLDGNGTLDLVYPSGQRRSDVMVRLQEGPRKWALESGFEIAPIAGFATLPGQGRKGRAGLITIDARTQELRQYDLTMDSRDDVLFDGPWFLALDPQIQSGQEFLVPADVNGDGRMDLVVASPRAAEMVLFQQEKDGRFTNHSAASLSDITTLAVAGDAKRPIILGLSGREETIGASAWTDAGELSVPRMLDVGHKPLAVAAADIDQTGKLDGLYLFMRSGEPASVRSLMLGVIENLDSRQALDAPPRFVTLLEDAKAQPTAMLAGDVSADGRVDLVVFYAYQPVNIFLQKEDATFQVLDTSQGLLKGVFSQVRPGQVAFADVNRDGHAELLVAQDNFVRAYAMQADNSLKLVEQFNGRTVSSRIDFVSTARLDGKSESIIMLDSGNQVITAYSPVSDGQWNNVRHFDLEGLRAEKMIAGDFNGDKRDDIVLYGAGKIRLFITSNQTRKLQTVWRRAPDEDGAKYVRVDTVQLFDAKTPTLLALEGTQHLLELYTRPADAPERFFHFKVFDDEQSIARSQEIRGTPEPREFITVDVDGDGLNDLVALTHDNILYYRRYER